MRYDWALDKGQDITLINISTDMRKLLIIRAKISGCDDFLTQECKEALVFDVADNRDLHKKIVDFGHHCCVVYGDYTDDFSAFAELMGMEVVLV